MVRGLALFVFLHGLVCTWAGFVLSPSEKQPLASGHEDARLRARAMAEDLLEALPSFIASFLAAVSPGMRMEGVTS